MRRAISRIIDAEPDLEVVDTAVNGKEGVAKAVALKPDVITLDIEMPVMDGLAALKMIQARCDDPKPAVLICSSLTAEGTYEALRAMQLGAADFITKDASQFTLGIDNIRDDLVAKIKAVGTMGSHRRPKPTVAARHVTPRLDLDVAKFDVVLIGSSTGGPPALESVLTKIPADFPLPIVVAQHMPEIFTRSLAGRLDEMCALTVVLGEQGMSLFPGTVYISPGGWHTRIARKVGGRYRIEVSPEPADALYKPSVNELFKSAAARTGGRALAVVLTGMGEDGLEGARPLHAAGGVILGQDMESCVVYGMPKAVAQAGLCAASMPPDALGKAVASLAKGGGSGARRAAG